MHVVEEFSLPVRNGGGIHNFTWVDQMPVPVMGVEAVVFSPVREAVLQPTPEPREILVMIHDQRLGLMQSMIMKLNVCI